MNEEEILDLLDDLDFYARQSHDPREWGLPLYGNYAKEFVRIVAQHLSKGQEEVAP